MHVKPVLQSLALLNLSEHLFFMCWEALGHDVSPVTGGRRCWTCPSRPQRLRLSSRSAGACAPSYRCRL